MTTRKSSDGTPAQIGHAKASDKTIRGDEHVATKSMDHKPGARPAHKDPTEGSMQRATRK
jgi:hypothetical protein